MAAKQHIFCIPFPGAGHGVNMLNVALALASPTLTVHTIVPSAAQAKTWMSATGQPPNDHMQIHVLGNGQWENWEPTSGMELVKTVISEEYAGAVETSITDILSRFAEFQGVAIVFNALMGRLVNIAARYSMKSYALNPIAYYMVRLGACHYEGASLTEKLPLHGIAGSDTPIFGELADVMDSTQPLFYTLFRSTFNAVHGHIFSGTNLGLDGEDYKQTHLPCNIVQKEEYFIGPLFPPWFENALDQPVLAQQKIAKAAQQHECIRLLDAHSSKSVVCISLGSHVELEPEQAQLIIANLRRHSIPWILLFRNDTAHMRSLLGDNLTDGVVTSWIPQLEVLVHPATKLVISHGGFGTMIEGVYAGQAFITAPVMSDQFIDQRVMNHLGISLGMIAENRMIPGMQRTKMSPFFPDDGGVALAKLFDEVFDGSEKAERKIQDAREAALALRGRMRQAKAKSGGAEMQRLRNDMRGVSAAVEGNGNRGGS